MNDAWVEWWGALGAGIAGDPRVSRLAFYAGMAEMAREFAAGQGPLLERLEALRAAILHQGAADTDFLIWSFEHNAWWKPRELGYTTDSAEAGRYTFGQALEICKRANITGIHEVIGLAPVRE